MLVFTVAELMAMTRIELCDLAARLTNALPDFPEHSRAYAAAQYTLWNIRAVLTQRREPGP